MVTRNELTSFINEYLTIDNYPDSSWNGLQYEGKETVEHIAVAVTAGIETFQKAQEVSADYLIVHHGLFWEGINPSLTTWQKKRMDMLAKADISLYAAHLPLDAHREVGNNTKLLELLDAQIDQPFYTVDGVPISWTGTLKKEKNIQEIESILTTQLPTTCITLPFGVDTIKKVAVVTGAGGYKGIDAAIQAGADLFITGDTAEIYHIAKDVGMHVIFAGHHATETLGVQALAQRIKQQFSVQTTFIDIPTRL